LKNPKIVKKQQKFKNIFLNIFASFLAFSTSSKEFKFSKIFGTRSTFNTLFLKLSISLIRVDVDKKNPKK
jgi:hypothetical protein